MTHLNQKKTLPHPVRCESVRRGRLSLAVALSGLLFGGLLATEPVRAETIVRASSFEYTAAGLLNKEVIEPDSPNDCLQTTYGYDNFGNKTSASSSACAGATGDAISSATVARTSGSGYGADGRFATSSTNALGQAETKAYDSRFGTVSSLTGPNGLMTTWVYDGFGRKTRETRADGTYTLWTYLRCADVGANCPGAIGSNTVSWVVIEQSYAVNGAVNGSETRQFHDTLNRVVRIQSQGFDGSGSAPAIVQDTQYNALGQVFRKSSLYALTGGTPVWTTMFYDALGRVTRQETPDPDAAGGVAVSIVAYNGLSITTTNPKSQTKTTLKNAQGLVAQVTDTQGGIITYSYSALGQLLQTNAAGSITNLSYNKRGQKTAMQDPAMGAWVYSYNAFGELVYQRDSLNQSATMAYDVLGRLIQRTEPDLISQWSYDKKFDGTPCGKGVGKLCEAKSDNGYNRVHTYDPLGRPSNTATVLDNAAAPATVSTAFDTNTGRPVTQTWPTGYQASYTYTALGYLKKVTGGGTNGFTQVVSYEVQAMDVQGHITQYRQGNQVTTVNTYDPTSSRLKGQVATLDGQASGNVYNQTYAYDALGNLLSRSDASPGVGTSETFTYDSLNRLTMATIGGGAVGAAVSTQVIYDTRGNITYKSDVGRYWYDAARPNRMTNITLETAPGATVALTGTRALSYTFDDYRDTAQVINGTTLGNGNLEYTVSDDNVRNMHTMRLETYTSFNMPKLISFGSYKRDAQGADIEPSARYLSFVYGPEHQRIKQNVTLSGYRNESFYAGDVWYLNGEDSQQLSYEKEIRTNGTIEHKHYVRAGGFTFALVVTRSGTLNGLPASSISYFQQDHLGSIAVITNEAGAVVERLAYDPWGKRRYINTMPGASDVMDLITGVRTDRGYTGHEHLDELGVIHANGRIYDPLIGRFMSADPIIQVADNLQNYNRYSYVLNNPLLFTDPSGYSFFGKLFKKLFKPILAVAVMYFAPEFAPTLYGGAAGAASLGISANILNGAIGGALAGAITGGNLKSALLGGLTGAMFGGAGLIGEADSFARYAAHFAAGCVSSVAGGGDCARGGVSAAIGKFATNATEAWGPGVAQGTAAVVAGGVGSVITGGNFWNGATTAAYGYMFNQLSQRSNMSCSMDGRSCTTTTFEERLEYTGRMSVQWNPIDWDDPGLMKTFSVDAAALVPNFASRVPGFELKVEGAIQRGEILHEARVDRQYYRLKIIDQIETSRVPLNYVQGNSYRWVSAPNTQDLRTRIQIQSCIGGAICAEWKR